MVRYVRYVRITLIVSIETCKEVTSTSFSLHQEMKASCMRLKLVEVTSLQVSMLTIRVILTYLTYLTKNKGCCTFFYLIPDLILTC